MEMEMLYLLYDALLVMQVSQPPLRVPRNAAQPMPQGYGTALPNGGPSPMSAAAPVPPPQPQAPPLSASERSAIAIEKVAREVGELEPQVSLFVVLR